MIVLINCHLVNGENCLLCKFRTNASRRRSNHMLPVFSKLCQKCNTLERRLNDIVETNLTRSGASSDTDTFLTLSNFRHTATFAK